MFVGIQILKMLHRILCKGDTHMPHVEEELDKLKKRKEEGVPAQLPLDIPYHPPEETSDEGNDPKTDFEIDYRV